MKRVLLIGEAPGRGRDGQRPFTGPCNARLTLAIGSDWRDWIECTNLLDYFPGRAGRKGASFPMSEAKRRAGQLENEMEMMSRLRMVLFAGKRVARAFMMGAVPFFHPCSCFAHEYLTAYVVPHPSGVSRWWNDPFNCLEAARFFAEIKRQACAK